MKDIRKNKKILKKVKDKSVKNENQYAECFVFFGY